ncbi:NAD(P)/FAD-dependent oxidoreductase [Curvivirga sp.]|uniref:NAD(P)/FAD-dependent oxidoreductase n=1 Tax=Curvivirga sp. TaxID=2856848 RepID=UPI003B5CA22D
MFKNTQYPVSYHTSVTKQLVPFSRLNGAKKYDVCVVGAGFMGCSTSIHLAKLGYKVCLVEAKRVGWGASGRNGGQLGYGMTKLQPDLIEQYTAEKTRIFWDISVESVELFHQLCEEYEIDCDFQSGNMACGLTTAHMDYLVKHANIVNGYGRQIFEILDQEETVRQTGSPIYKGSILSHRAGHINPLKYVLGLAKAAQKLGVDIYEESPALAISDGIPAQVTFHDGQIFADKIVLGCNGYIGNLNKTLAKRILPVDNYQAATEPLDDHILKSVINNGACAWDMARSVHYFRITPDRRLTMGCAIGIPNRKPRNLERECRKHLEYVYPHLTDVKLDYIWGGTLGGNHESLPDVGQLSENIFFAQAFTGHGVGLAPLLGKLIAEKINGTSDKFDFLARVKHRNIIGGTKLRIPAVLAYKFFTNSLDMLTRYKLNSKK